LIYRHSVLVARAAEVAQLAAFVDRLEDGPGSALVIRGPAGVGKSALFDAISARGGARVLHACGVDADAGYAFAGLIELLYPVLPDIGSLPPRPRRALRRSLALETGRTDALASIVALTMLLARLATEQPVLCLVDDAQWLDESTADALLLAARWHPERVGFVFAVRDEPVQRFDQTWLPTMSIDNLGDAASRELLASEAPGLPGAAVEGVIAAADGNPLALLEFARAAEDGWDSAPFAGAPRLGSRLEAKFSRAARQLPEPARRALLLLAASDLEDQTRMHGVLASFAGHAHPLDPAVAAGLVSADGSRLRFRHPLVRSAVYQSAPAELRRAAHHALAEAFRSHEPERASWHDSLCADGPDEEIARTLEQTAELARRRGGRSAEARALERAARLTPDRGVADRRLVGAAAARLAAGQLDTAERLLTEVADRGDDVRVLADAEHNLAQLAFWHNGVRRPTLQRVAAAVEPVDPGRAAQLLSYDLISLITDQRADLALPIAERAWALIGGGIEPPEVAWRVAMALLMGGRTADGMALTARLADAAECTGQLAAMVNVAQPLTWVERYGDARRLLELAESKLRSIGGLWMLGHALVFRATLEQYTGNLGAARLAAAEALALAEQLDQPMQQAEACMQLAWAAARAGDESEAVELTAQSLSLVAGRESGTGELCALAASALGGAALAAGRIGDAIAHLEPAVTRILGGGVADPAVVPGLGDLIEAHAIGGRHAEAQRLLDVLATQAASCDRRWAHLETARCRVVLRQPGGESQLRSALERDDGQARLVTGRAWLTLGIEQRQRGRRTAAVTSLHRAHQRFRAAGASAWSNTAAEHLRASGEVLAADRDDPLTTLTPQETRVAQLVATGARNREVAAELFVTTKTVEYHLAAVYRKLGVRSRSELTGIITRRAGAEAAGQLA
jgi:DNA-binding CsgD family transcriptional regulator